MQQSDGSDLPMMKVHSRLVQPHQHDVLLGRGKSNIRHPGNVIYQSLITSNRERYFQETLSQKKEIILEILRNVQQRDGRFLSPQSNGWVMVSNATARQKIAHSLQYRQRCSLKQENISQPPESPGRADSRPSIAVLLVVANPGEEVNIGIPKTDSSPEKISIQENIYSPKMPQDLESADEVSAEIAQFMAGLERHTSSSSQILSSYLGSHSVKSIEAQLEHHHSYSDHDLSAYHLAAETIGSGPYANSAIYHPSTELQRHYQHRYPDHQLGFPTGEAPYAHTTKSSIPDFELDSRCDAYQYSYPLPSNMYAITGATEEDRKMPPPLDALDTSGVHSLTTILSYQESADYTFLSYPQYSSLKHSDAIGTLQDSDVLQTPANFGSDDSPTSAGSDKGSPHIKPV